MIAPHQSWFTKVRAAAQFLEQQLIRHHADMSRPSGKTVGHASMVGGAGHVAGCQRISCSACCSSFAKRPHRS